MGKFRFLGRRTSVPRGPWRSRYQDFFDLYAGASPDEIRAAWRRELGGEPSEMIVAAIERGEATARSI